MKIGQLTLLSMRNRNIKDAEKWTEPKGQVGFYPSINTGSIEVPGNRGGGTEETFEEIMAKYFPNLSKDMNLKFSKFQVGYSQGDPL